MKVSGKKLNETKLNHQRQLVPRYSLKYFTLTLLMFLKRQTSNQVL